jgi:hypothetical protein
LFLLSTFLLLPIVQAESHCNETSNARIESARGLLDGLNEITETRKAMQVERVRILLEKVLSEEPNCGDATVLKNQADRLFKEVEVLSSNAAAEQVLARAERLVVSLEGTEKVDPAELQATRFLIAALSRRLPTEPKVSLLAARAAALGKSE